MEAAALRDFAASCPLSGLYGLCCMICAIAHGRSLARRFYSKAVSSILTLIGYSNVKRRTSIDMLHQCSVRNIASLNFEAVEFHFELQYMKGLQYLLVSETVRCYCSDCHLIFLNESIIIFILKMKVHFTITYSISNNLIRGKPSIHQL